MPDPRATAAHLEAIVDDLADPSPLPAGGAAGVAAVAMGVGLAILAASKPRRGEESVVAELAGELGALRKAVAPLLVADCDAYAATLTGSSADREAAWVYAIAVPISVAEQALRTIEIIDQLDGRVRPALAGDLAAARILSVAGAEISLGNARENRSAQADAFDAALAERYDLAAARLGVARDRSR